MRRLLGARGDRREHRRLALERLAERARCGRDVVPEGLRERRQLRELDELVAALSECLQQRTLPGQRDDGDAGGDAALDAPTLAPRMTISSDFPWMFHMALDEDEQRLFVVNQAEVCTRPVTLHP